MIRLVMSAAHRRSIHLDRMLMIGRQNLHLSADQLTACFDEFDYGAVNGQALISDHNTFAEGVFERMGSTQVDSLDASDYEDATLIHDLNVPLPDSFKNQYDLVLDSGTLEHVFNVPTALKSCMELTKVGGHYIGIYPCNNFFGHGFYQFSSELFYRTLSPENGFEVIDMILFVDEPNTIFYSIKDTSEQHPRVQFTNQKPVYIYVLAKKVNERAIFETPPLQMDYAAMKWKGNRPQKTNAKHKRAVNMSVPSYIKRLIKALINKKPPSDNDRFQKSFLTPYALK